MKINDQQQNLLRQLPGVDLLLTEALRKPDYGRVPKSVVVRAIRDILEARRNAILSASDGLATQDLSAETLLQEPRATALCIYPTKALAQDQLRGLIAFQDEEAGIQFMAGTYDGDTPSNLRRKIRDSSGTW